MEGTDQDVPDGRTRRQDVRIRTSPTAGRPRRPPDGPTAPETPLHSAASSDDVAALDALLDGGANIESPGAVFTGGTAMSDAVIFACWNAARRLLERGAKTNLTQSAGLGLMDRLVTFFDEEPGPPQDQITAALWHACRGGQLPAVKYLIEKGADLNWIGWDKLSPFDCAHKSGNAQLMEWLRTQGAKSTTELIGHRHSQ